MLSWWNFATSSGMREHAPELGGDSPEHGGEPALSLTDWRSPVNQGAHRTEALGAQERGALPTRRRPYPAQQQALPAQSALGPQHCC